MPTRADAWLLLCDWTKTDALRRHGLAVEAAVAWYGEHKYGITGDELEVWRSAGLLGDAVRTLTGHGIPVVAGTCPDFGVIIGIPQPLRGILGTWSTGLAALQDRAVIDAGGATVALGRLVGPQFAGNPEMFARDHFHPSGAGYGRAMTAMLPTLIDQLDRAAAPMRGKPDQARSA